jgi:hypothetical protein
MNKISTKGIRLVSTDPMDTFVKLALEKIVKASSKKDEELRATSKRVTGMWLRGFCGGTLPSRCVSLEIGS